MLPYVSGVRLCCDNRAVIDFSWNKIDKTRSKHIDISYHLVRKKIDEGSMELLYVPSKENYKDILTKGLKATMHNKCARMLML